MASPVTNQTRPGPGGLLSDHVNRIELALGYAPEQVNFPEVKDVPWAEEMNQIARALVAGLDTAEPYDLFIDGLNVISHARGGYFTTLEAENDGASTTDPLLIVRDTETGSSGTMAVFESADSSTGQAFMEFLARVDEFTANTVAKLNHQGGWSCRSSAIESEIGAAGGSIAYGTIAVQEIDLSLVSTTVDLFAPTPGYCYSDLHVTGIVTQTITGSGGLATVKVGIYNGIGNEIAIGAALPAYSAFVEGMGGAPGIASVRIAGGTPFEIQVSPGEVGATITGGKLLIRVFGAVTSPPFGF